jgi:purine-binding chemotaxis protein CheW
MPRSGAASAGTIGADRIAKTAAFAAPSGGTTMVQAMAQEMKQDTVQVLTVPMAGEVFALDIAGVREVLDRTDVVRLPRMPDPLCGVANLRGSVIPVIDLRSALGFARAERISGGCIIVAELVHRGEMLVVGALADAVGEVIDLDRSMLMPPPRIGDRLQEGIIGGLAQHNGRQLIILDLERVLETEIAPRAGNLTAT